MKITQSKNGFTLFASSDEAQMMALALVDFRAAPEERALSRRMSQQLIAALPVAQLGDENDDEDEDELFAPAKEADDDDDL
jgi:hypothetical protein